jgi:sulfate adenylyltransferase subunit 1
VITLADEIDISRGDMLVGPNSPPESSQDVEVMLCWFNERPLQPGGKYALRHTSKDARCMVKEVRYKMDINTLRKADDAQIRMNDIGRVLLRTTVPLHTDKYARNRHTGSLILIDEGTNETVAAGMVV